MASDEEGERLERIRAISCPEQSRTPKFSILHNQQINVGVTTMTCGYQKFQHKKLQYSKILHRSELRSQNIMLKHKRRINCNLL